jgi:hypothetical protein
VPLTNLVVRADFPTPPAEKGLSEQRQGVEWEREQTSKDDYLVTMHG